MSTNTPQDIEYLLGRIEDLEDRIKRLEEHATPEARRPSAAEGHRQQVLDFMRSMPVGTLWKSAMITANLKMDSNHVTNALKHMNGRQVTKVGEGGTTQWKLSG